MRVEAFGLYQRTGMQSEAALSSMLRGVLLSAEFYSRRCGKDIELAVGEDSVNVEQKKFDFPGARLRHAEILHVHGKKPAPCEAGRYMSGTSNYFLSKLNRSVRSLM